MKYLLAILVCGFIFLSASAQVPQYISYQGLLTTSSGSNMPDGNYNMTFSLHKTISGGSPIYTQIINDVAVSRGTFNVQIHVPNDTVPFTEPYYIEFTVNSGPGITSPITFSPRSELTSAPYAMQSVSMLGPNSQITGVCGVAGGSNNRARGPYAVVAGGGGPLPEDSNSALGWRSAILGGRRNIAKSFFSVVCGGDNNESEYYSFVGAGNFNRAYNHSVVGGGYVNGALGMASSVCGGAQNYIFGNYSSIGGGHYNIARGMYAVIGGGGGENAPDSNSAMGDYSAILGGSVNRARGQHSIIGGGYGNVADNYASTIGGGEVNEALGLCSTIPGGQNNEATGNTSTVGGGSENKANGDRSTVSGGAQNFAIGFGATIGGGQNNIARGMYSVIAGGGALAPGDSNSAAGDYSMILGGKGNSTQGAYSLAAGRRAKALHDGSFVWADHTNADFSSTAQSQFLIRAGGGMGLNTNSPESMLDVRPGTSMGLSIQSTASYNTDDIVIKRPGSLSSSNVRFSLSERSTNNVLWIYGYDGTTFRNFVGFDFANNKIIYPANNGGALTIDNTNSRIGVGGITSPNQALDVAGTAQLRGMSSGPGTAIVDLGTGVLGRLSSSIRYKTNVRDLEMNKDVLNLRPVRFQWKETGKEDIGLIAEEVEKINKDLVIYNDEGQPESVKYDRIAVYLISIIKDQQNQIEELKNALKRFSLHQK